MKTLFILLLFSHCVFVFADDVPRICTTDLEKTKAISASDFDSVKFPLSVADLIEVWGLGYRSEYSGGGSIYWKCVDGRIAIVGPVSDLDTILNDDQVSVFGADVDWDPFGGRISVFVGKDGVTKVRSSEDTEAK